MELDKALFFKDRNEWRKWLEKNYSKESEAILIHYKKSSGKEGLNHFDAVEEALCFGWIDSKLRRIDEERFMLRYTPRKEKSVWSKKNKDTAERMVQSGKMAESGFEKIELAKKHGLWDAAYTNLVKERLPSDLKKALMKDNIAWKNFQSFANSYRNTYIGWVKNAKIETTRNRRINEVVTRSKDNKKPGIE